jgi:hypothetical protein
VVSGSLAHVTESGCEFISRETTLNQGEPGFASRGVICLNLLNPKTGKSMSVQAQVAGISRQEGHWALQLGWQECPEILK